MQERHHFASYTRNDQLFPLGEECRVSQYGLYGRDLRALERPWCHLKSISLTETHSSLSIWSLLNRYPWETLALHICISLFPHAPCGLRTLRHLKWRHNICFSRGKRIGDSKTCEDSSFSWNFGLTRYSSIIEQHYLLASPKKHLCDCENRAGDGHTVCSIQPCALESRVLFVRLEESHSIRSPLCKKDGPE